MSRISEIRSSAYGELRDIISEVETRYFARRRDLIELGGDWTRDDIMDMLLEIFDNADRLEYTVDETISGGLSYE